MMGPSILMDKVARNLDPRVESDETGVVKTERRDTVTHPQLRLTLEDGSWYVLELAEWGGPPPVEDMMRKAARKRGT